MGVETGVGPNKSNLYNFRKADGELIGVWGTTLLDSRFKNLEVGDEVKLIYKGKMENPKTKRIYHNFDVFRAKKDDEIPVIEEE
jgi:adenine specific DNA methylase Mod